MNLQLKEKRALITGSSSGIGAGIAAVLARQGVSVIVHGRDIKRTQEVARGINESGGRAAVVIADLTTAEGCAHVADAGMQRLGGVDVLVNNAGGRASAHRPDSEDGTHPTWLDIPWSDWLWTFEQNVGAAVRLIQHLVPGMRERRWGRVINIGSASATQTLSILPNTRP